MFVDAFNIAGIMKQKYPDYFKLLCQVPVDWTDIATDIYGNYHKLCSNSVIRCVTSTYVIIIMRKSVDIAEFLINHTYPFV